MASLGEVLGALISQMGKGRSQADISTLEVAKIYKDHPLLSSFPIPRVTLDEVVIDLKMSIAAAPTMVKVLTSESKSRVLAQLEEKLSALISTESSLDSLSRQFPDFQKIWKLAQSQMIQKLSEFIPLELEIEAKSIALGIASAIRGHLTDVVSSPEAKVQAQTAMNFLNKDAPQIQSKLASQIQEILSKAIEAQPTPKDRIDVLITSSELQGIPPEKLTTMKLTMRESDLTWSQIETEKGEIRDKLIPS